ncbi:hypothetical protein GCM10009577_47200 [Streptomyces javensis]
MALVETDHPLLGGDPTHARWISPPTGRLTCGRTPHGRGRPIASQVQGRDEQSRMGEAQREAPPKGVLDGSARPAHSTSGRPRLVTCEALAFTPHSVEEQSKWGDE